MKDEFFSSVGRISQVVYIVRVILLVALVAVVFKVSTNYFHHDPAHEFLMPLAYFFTIVTSIFATLTILMQSIKRLHDMEKGPMWASLLFVPGLNVLFILYAVAAPSRAK